MTAPTKIDFPHRRVRRLDDLTDLVEMLLPGNRNQQHAAARILLELKRAQRIVPNLAPLQDRYGVSRRTLQRARAKLARLGLIERVTWMNRRYGGQEGWRLSGRMSAALRRLADRLDRWRAESRPGHIEKEEILASCLRPRDALRAPCAGSPWLGDAAGGPPAGMGGSAHDR